MMKFSHSPQLQDNGDCPKWLVDLVDGMMARAQYESGMGENLAPVVLDMYGHKKSADLFEWYDVGRGMKDGL